MILICFAVDYPTSLANVEDKVRQVHPLSRSLAVLTKNDHSVVP